MEVDPYETHPLIRHAIDAWLAVRSEYIDVAAVFTAFTASAYGQPLARAITAKTAWRIVRKYAEAAGVAGIKPHDFRRFVGTQLAARDLRVAQLALGHKLLETTARHYVASEDQHCSTSWSLCRRAKLGVDRWPVLTLESINDTD